MKFSEEQPEWFRRFIVQYVCYCFLTQSVILSEIASFQRLSDCGGFCEISKSTSDSQFIECVKHSTLTSLYVNGVVVVAS